MKVVRYDQLDTMRLPETSSGTSCPPQPHRLLDQPDQQDHLETKQAK